jgi:hypothetical protein
MTKREKLIRDIETLRASIRQDWADLARLSLTAEDRAGIGRHVQLCIEELHDLIGRLDGAQRYLKATGTFDTGEALWYLFTGTPPGVGGVAYQFHQTGLARQKLNGQCARASYLSPGLSISAAPYVRGSHLPAPAQLPFGQSDALALMPQGTGAWPREWWRDDLHQRRPHRLVEICLYRKRPRSERSTTFGQGR